jgi:hypothetical protein
MSETRFFNFGRHPLVVVPVLVLASTVLEAAAALELQLREAAVIADESCASC